jgi:gamma-glutamyltranspeptidase / glutathione hydrolase
LHTATAAFKLKEELKMKITRTIGVIGIILIFLMVIMTGCEPAAEEPEAVGEITEDEEVDEPEVSFKHVEAIVSAHRLATEAGIKILADGGTAADAAITVAAVLTVVEPYFSSVFGGGTWALYYDAEKGEVTSLDGVGPIGSNATISDYAARGGSNGIHQAVVPGAWDGWMLWLIEYGVMDLEELLEPAIRIAREGYPVGSSMSGYLNAQSSLIANNSHTAAIYMPDGRLVQAGDIIYQHDLADTFEDFVGVYNEALVRGRNHAVQAVRDHFYRGPYAEAIVDYSDSNRGYLTIDDFNMFAAEIVTPISISYNEELEVFQNPPNSQGITQLLALNILKGFDFSVLDVDAPETIHLQIEALKLAFADRHFYIGDPARVRIPLTELLSDQYADSQRQRIDRGSAMRWPIEAGLAGENELGGTTTYHIVDNKGNAAAVTTSLGFQFLVIGDTGIHINNRMRMSSTDEGTPNQLTPGYKVRHTSNPYLVLKDGKPYILGGNTGADTQPQGQVQQFINIVEFGLSAQEAADRPRFYTTAMPSGTYPYEIDNTLQVQESFPSAIRDGLRGLGHSIRIGGIFGSAHILVIHESGYDAEAGEDPGLDTSYGIVIPVQVQ